MAYSSIPAAKAQLLTTLQARVGLAGVLIQWGIPTEPPPDLERVYLDDAVEVEREWATLGTLKITESYILPVAVEVFQYGNDQRACEERMWTITAEIEQAALGDVTLAGILRHWGAKPGGLDPHCVPSGVDGWLAYVTLNFDCAARI